MGDFARAKEAPKPRWDRNCYGCGIISDYKMVLPGLALVEAESPAKEIDGGFEMLFVSIATGPAPAGHDLAVQPFGHGVRHPVAAISQDVAKVSLYHDGHLANRLQA